MPFTGGELFANGANRRRTLGISTQELVHATLIVTFTDWQFGCSGDLVVVQPLKLLMNLFYNRARSDSCSQLE